MHNLLNSYLLRFRLTRVKLSCLNNGYKRGFTLAILLLLSVAVANSFGQCPVYNMRAGSSLYFCGSSNVTATVTMGGSSVDHTYQLIRNGNSTIGDLVQGTGSSSMKWTVYQPGTYTVMEYGGACGGGTLMNGSTVITDLGTPPTVRINSENSNYRCVGQSISFTAQNGSSYSWYNNGQLTNVTTSTYTPSTSQAGTYTIKVQGTNACGVSQSDDVTLFVGSYPTASILAQGATTFCGNGSVVLQAQSNGNSFQWLKDGEVLSGYTSTTYTVSAGGSYTVKASFTGEDCATESSPIVINSLALPIATISPTETASILYGNEGVVLTASTGSNYTYQWYNNQQLISGETQSTFEATQAGKYSVKITTGNGCSNTSSETTVVENNYNYIGSRTIQVDAKTDGSPIAESDLINLSKNEKLESITYYDGLGRTMQTVDVNGSPLGNDIVQPVMYDAFGREIIKYLPYSSTESNGHYKINSTGTSENYTTSDQAKFYQNGTSGTVASDAKPYAETQFEASPLNRILKQGAPGAAWQPNDDSDLDKSVKHSYEFNNENEVILFSYNATTGAVSVGSTGTVDYYTANQLHANKMKDEHGNEVIEYVDKEEYIVCKKVQYGTDATTSTKLYASTYYIYDDFGNLVFVIPPEGVKAIVPSAN